MTHLVGALCEEHLAFELLTRLSTHGDLRCPAHQLGFATQGAEGVPRARRDRSESAEAWRDLCANQRRPAEVLGLGNAIGHSRAIELS